MDGFDTLPISAVERKLALNWVNEHGLNLRDLEQKYRDDPEIALAAIENSPHALEYAPDQFKSDRSLVLSLVKKVGMALKHASPDLQADEEIVAAAINQSWIALVYASPELQHNREMGLSALNQSSYALPYISDTLRNEKVKNRDFLLHALTNDGNGNALQFLSSDMLAQVAPDVLVNDQSLLKALKLLTCEQGQIVCDAIKGSLSTMDTFDYKKIYNKLCDERKAEMFSETFGVEHIPRGVSRFGSNFWSIAKQENRQKFNAAESDESDSDDDDDVMARALSLSLNEF